mmetsp:Transcript_13562/g.23082  ORF Transcript_13562/g.23082 Transcript_13562/m.23082 type:complete len:98 (-) Transcript_13562:553-846(-)
MRKLEGNAATTFACRQVRVAPFRAKLELEYYYLVEFFGDGPHSLEGIQSAVQQAVVASLNTCDEQDQPSYAVAFGPSHSFATDGTYQIKIPTCDSCS